MSSNFAFQNLQKWVFFCFLFLNKKLDDCYFRLTDYVKFSYTLIYKLCMSHIFSS